MNTLLQPIMTSIISTKAKHRTGNSGCGVRFDSVGILAFSPKLPEPVRAMENSPPFQRWVNGSDGPTSPVRGERSPRAYLSLSAVPAGLIPFARCSPTVETVGYFRMSLRDSTPRRISPGGFGARSRLTCYAGTAKDLRFPTRIGNCCGLNYAYRSVAVLALLMCALGIALSACAAGPALRQVKPAYSPPSLLRNGGFEESQNGKLTDWSAAQKGFALAAGQGRNGSRALFCENSDAKEWTGASQTLLLNRTNAIPLTVRGWSKAENVSGSPDSGYSLYVDIEYQDGAPLWGQTANFRTGTHDWQERELLIIPEKPVKSLTLHCILRGHSGNALFDDVSLAEAKAEGGAVIFEGVPIALDTPRRASSTAGSSIKVQAATKDGLVLKVGNGTVQSLRVGGKELAGPSPAGFLVRDVAAGSDFCTFNGGADSPELGLKLQAEFKARPDHIAVSGRISDTSGKDRAVTLLFALPIDATGWHWGEDIRSSRVISGNAALVNAVNVGCGATGTMSLYPLAAVYGEKEGLAIGLDMAQPAQYRLVCHPGTKQFYIAYDFGLVPEAERFPGAADFRFIIFRFDPGWGFRAAFQKYMSIFPESFRVRSSDQGIWMPFTDVSKVQGWQDFGFKYHEGNNNVPWDDEHGVLSFRYTEPMTWWMRMEKEIPRTTAETVQIRDELARSGKGHEAIMAQVTQPAAMWDDSGQPALTFRDTPWCNGAVWSLNPNPNLPAASGAGTEADGRPRYNAATVYWNNSVKQNLYGARAKGKQDGEYLDSIEGYVTTDLNFRREHFRYTSVPLTFATDSKRPALWKGLAVYEFTRWMSGEVHQMGKLMFANGVPYRLSFLCPWLDVLGTETDWLQNGKYRPASDSQMSLWRTMSGGKPYLLLMNTDYDRFTPELVEKYFQRSLFYGIFPSMFSHNASENPYWQNPKWYNRDRELFKKYIPLVKRVAEAGWQPVTLARCDNERIFVERFGPDKQGKVFWTLLNDATTRQSGQLQFGQLKFRDTPLVELISGAVFQPSKGEPLGVTLQPQEAKVIGCSVVPAVR